MVPFDVASFATRMVEKTLSLDQHYLEAIVEGCRITRHGEPCHAMQCHAVQCYAKQCSATYRIELQALLCTPRNAHYTTMLLLLILLLLLAIVRYYLYCCC